MKRTLLRNKALLAIGIMTVLAVPFTDALARGDGRHGDGNWNNHSRGREVRRNVIVHRNKLISNNGRFHHRIHFGGHTVIAPPRRAVIARLPFGYATVVIGGRRFYARNNVYYTDCPGGYVVTTNPIVFRR